MTTSTYEENPEMLNLTGVNLARNGKFEEALECFCKAVRLNPNNARAWYNIGTVLKMLGKEEHDLLILHCLERAIELNPHDVEALNNKGAVLVMMDKTEEAILCFQRALEIDPRHSRTLSNLGSLMIKLGQKKSVKKYLQQ